MRCLWWILNCSAVCCVQFLPENGSIHASLKRCGKHLHLTIEDSGSGIAESVMGSLFHRYLRQPGIEDSRFGIGLGMVLIRSAAAAHGGTVLIDHPQDCGTRVTLSLTVSSGSGTSLRSPLLKVDYAGERDHGLLELSDVLPAKLYAIE